MKKVIVFLFISVLVNAQTHRFIYEYKFKEDSTVNNFRSENMVLDINPDSVKFYPYEYAENDSLNKVRDFKNVMWDEALPALKRKRDSNTNTNFILLNDFFTIQTEDKIDWKLTNETKKSEGYTLQKALTDFGGRNWEAWFCKEVEIPEGPYKFRGLPGLIFEIRDSKDNFYFSLAKSYNLKDTYNTSEFLEAFAGSKPLEITEKIYHQKLLELYADPLRDMREDFKNSSGNVKYKILGTEVKSIDQFRDLTLQAQERMRKNNNPLELNKAPQYPTK